MRRFLLLLLVLPLLAGACGDDATEDTPDPPATTLPAGTRDDPFGVGDLAAAAGKSAVWVRGYVAGAEADAKAAVRSVGSDTPSRSNILLAAKANEYRPDKCIRVELPDESDIQARLNVVDHPDLIGRKVLLHADIVAGKRLRAHRQRHRTGGRQGTGRETRSGRSRPARRTGRPDASRHGRRRAGQALRLRRRHDGRRRRGPGRHPPFRRRQEVRRMALPAREEQDHDSGDRLAERHVPQGRRLPFGQTLVRHQAHRATSRSTARTTS